MTAFALRQHHLLKPAFPNVYELPSSQARQAPLSSHFEFLFKTHAPTNSNSRSRYYNNPHHPSNTTQTSNLKAQGVEMNQLTVLYGNAKTRSLYLHARAPHKTPHPHNITLKNALFPFGLTTFIPWHYFFSIVSILDFLFKYPTC